MKLKLKDINDVIGYAMLIYGIFITELVMLGMLGMRVNCSVGLLCIIIGLIVIRTWKDGDGGDE